MKNMIKFILNEIIYLLIKLTGKPNNVIELEKERLEIYYFSWGELGITELIFHRPTLSR